jgi:hypothetical protein
MPTPLQTCKVTLACALAALLGWPGAARADTDLNDPDQYREAQDYMLLRVNNERSRNGAGSVRFDPAAAELARQHAQDMLENGFFSHWNLDGLKPTRRWNLMGGFDCVSENIYFREGQLGDMRKIVDDAMETLMNSAGHRRTILQAEHNRLGLAFAFDGQRQQVYVVQEFVTRLGGDYRCDLYAPAGSVVTLTGRIDPSDYAVEQVIVGWEERPQRREKHWLARSGEYKEAEKLVAGYSPRSNIVFNDISTYHDISYDAASGSFSANVKLDYKNKPGLYYLFVWLRNTRLDKPVLAAILTVEAQR